MHWHCLKPRFLRFSQKPDHGRTGIYHGKIRIYHGPTKIYHGRIETYHGKIRTHLGLTGIYHGKIRTHLGRTGIHHGKIQTARCESAPGCLLKGTLPVNYGILEGVTVSYTERTAGHAELINLIRSLVGLIHAPAL